MIEGLQAGGWWVAAGFRTGGGDHVAAVAATGLVALGLILWARRRPGSAGLRLCEVALAALLVGVWPAVVLVAWRQGWLTWEVALPLHWCNVAAGMAAAALVWPRRLLAELTYFWGLAGTIHGLLTPVMLGEGFPSIWYFVYFIGHGGVIVAALHLVLGRGLVPGRGAVWRVFGLAQVYLLVAWLVNLAIGSNFAFLSGKPGEGSLLDYLGPWPYYILSFQLIGLLMFTLLDMPFWRGRRARAQGAA
jgi:hypothetical integral membrane protein (TIGR02206 family)